MSIDNLLLGKRKTRMANFYAFVVAFSIVYLSSAQNDQDDYSNAISKAGEKCKMKVSLEDDIYKQLMSGASMPDKQKVKCFMSCFIMELGYYQDGSFNEENVKTFLMKRYSDPDVVDKKTKMMQKCAQQVRTSENDCEFAYKIVQCLVRDSASDKMGIPIFMSSSS